METKLRAAKMVTAADADLIIAQGAHPENLYRILDGEHVGTRFRAK